jgi:hypothetical protein
MFDRFFCILKVKNHLENKPKILNTLQHFHHQYNNENTDDEISFISNTDWEMNTINWYDFSISNEDKERYQKLVQKKFSKKVIIGKTWFNQYYPNSGAEHPFHTHKYCNLSNVYVVEGGKQVRTVLKCPKTGKEITPRVNKGEILIFPSNILHKSPKNFTNKRKTVIVFNSKFN